VKPLKCLSFVLETREIILSTEDNYQYGFRWK